MAVQAQACLGGKFVKLPDLTATYPARHKALPKIKPAPLIDIDQRTLA
jgi:hypothetical protein